MVQKRLLRWSAAAAALLTAAAAQAAACQAAAPPAAATAATPAAPAAPAVSASPLVPRLAYRQRTLANGLTVLSAENHNTPTVAIYVWYKVGGKNDPPGRSGFAHLFEHLMFKSTKNQPAENFDRLTEDVGGENNAYTADDVTVFHETVPSNYLETLLWAEADRMANLNVDEANFLSERKVVEEELRQRVLASPYGNLPLVVAKDSWQVLPYKREPIGSIHDLEAATLADVQQFHATYYRPDNAVLVVVGDFAPGQLDAWVDRYFGPVPRPDAPIPRVTEAEPPRAVEKGYGQAQPGVPLPIVVMDYLVPNAASADAPALQIADAILSGGESSRLYHSLVYTQQVASSANSGADLRELAGLFEVDVTAASGKPLPAVEKAARAEVAAFAARPVTPQELLKARNQLITGNLRTRETDDGTAEALGRAAVYLGDPEEVNAEITKLQAVTAQDVQRVARKYFTDQNLVVVRYGTADQIGRPAASAAPSPQATPAPKNGGPR